MYLGNDIIDTAKALTNFKNKKTRLHSYSLSLSEKKRFEKLLEEDIYFWLIWSMKEALYKSYVKAGLRERFAPKTIEVLSIAKQSAKHLAGHGFFNNALYHICSTINDISIHTIAYQGQAEVIQVERKINNKDYTSQHQAVRRLALEQLPTTKEKIWSIKKDFNQIPYLLLNGNRCHHEISLSHHENIVGVAILF